MTLPSPLSMNIEPAENRRQAQERRSKRNITYVGGLLVVICFLGIYIFATQKGGGGAFESSLEAEEDAMEGQEGNPQVFLGNKRNQRFYEEGVYGGLKISKTTQWCLEGDCDCTDPFEPVSREHLENWRRAFEKNVNAVEEAADKDLDIVFVGDSLVEGWNGRWGAHPLPDLKGIAAVFDQLFGRDKALALGVAGDSSQNVLWRLQNGEMPDTLKPRVWWIVVGTVDLGTGGCSEDVVAMGMMRVAAELAELRPEQKVVMNQLLPRTTHQTGALMGDTTTKKKEGGGIPDLWPSIERINARVKDIVHNVPNVYFYDGATDIFLTEDRQSVRNELMGPDHVHPNKDGYEAWGRSILDFIKNISKEP